MEAELTPKDSLLRYKVIGCCLLAPAFDANLTNAIALAFDALIGYTPVHITHFGILGCYPEQWMFVTAFFVFIPIIFTINIAGFRFSRSEQTHFKLLGALLLFGSIFHPAKTILYEIAGNYHPFSFIQNKGRLEEQIVPFFVNGYIFMWVKTIVNNGLQLFYLYLCYRVAFRYWDKQLRFYFFTYGAAACALGLYLWYFVIGPVLYR
jgi:hypothetical protein